MIRPRKAFVERVRFPLLLGLGAVALAGLLLFLLRRPHPPVVQAALTLVLGGALGNYSDRAVRGYVVDFIHAAHWPVFNVADIWVTLGGLALLLHTWRATRGGTAPPPSLSTAA